MKVIRNSITCTKNAPARDNNRASISSLFTVPCSPVCLLLAFAFTSCNMLGHARHDEIDFDKVFEEKVTAFLLQNEERPIPFYASLEEAVDSLAMGNRVSEYGNNGWGGIPPAYRFARQIRLGFEPAQLDSLARRHPSPAVRAVAGSILIEEKSPLVVPLVMDHLGDTGGFEYQSFDIIYHDNVANYWVKRALRAHLFTEADSLRLVDTLIYGSNMGHIDLQWMILSSLEPLPQYYDIFRRICLEEDRPEALPWIAQYRRIEDTVLVLEALHCYSADDSRDTPEERKMYNYMMARRNAGLRSVAKWPLPIFQPLLDSIRDDLVAGLMDRGGAFYLFSAVMAYQSEWSKQFIEETFDKVMQHKDNDPQDYYDGKGRWTFWWGECFERAYSASPDEYYANLYKKYACK